MNNSVPNPPSGQRLTLAQCRKILWGQAALLAILLAFAAMLFHENHLWLAAGPLFAALGQALIFPALWKQYQATKNGAVIYSPAKRPEAQMPRVVAIGFISLVTVFVALCSAFIVFVVNANFATQLGWTICGVVLLALWTFIGYLWYRIITEPPKTPMVTVQEPLTEGVWPPPPTTLNHE